MQIKMHKRKLTHSHAQNPFNIPVGVCQLQLQQGWYKYDGFQGLVAENTQGVDPGL